MYLDQYLAKGSDSPSVRPRENNAARPGWQAEEMLHPRSVEALAIEATLADRL
ncbi:hypothetical protein LT85_4107 [Collimonas arenae]|uniref:Uncharacterized protein n=1 Tax=Collimonas arenae TaxID=279058 RepID=A0A0A1FHX7_9BURK|nr:hypothetical protein LT85_4107 [Collimonas arenae]